LRGNLIRLVTGASWLDIEAILDHQVSDTTRPARRDEWIDDEWIDAGVRATSRPLRDRSPTQLRWFPEEAVDESDCHGALTDRGRHSLGRAAAHVTGGEHTGP